MEFEFKIGEIKECKKVEGSEKLLRLVVDFGEETLRVVFSGMGEESQAMIFAAGSDEDISILLLDKDMPVGTEVF